MLDMRKVFGVKHSATLTSMENLANTYSNQGNLNEAEQLQVQVLVIQKKLLDVEHPDTLQTIGNLAGTYWN